MSAALKTVLCVLGIKLVLTLLVVALIRHQRRQHAAANGWWLDRTHLPLGMNQKPTLGLLGPAIAAGKED